MSTFSEGMEPWSFPVDARPDRHVHFIGISGKAMGGIAAALAREGWVVTGSDEKCYPPMSEYLLECGIPIFTPYGVGNTPVNVGTVVVGKRVAADNPELLHVLESGIPHQSFPQFLRERFLCRSRNAVVAGGVGKTTTTSMLAWILEHSGRNPDYLIGGQARNFSAPAKFAGSDFTVLEGDEYASCFDDSQPKFLHYRPEVAVITNIIEDHPDLYESIDEVCAAFAALIATLPSEGCLVISDDDASALRLAKRAGCRVVSTGFTESANVRIHDLHLLPDRSCFRLLDASFEIGLCGRMNVSNAAMAVLASVHFGVTPHQAAAALRLFSGVANRQEQREVGTCTVVGDKATHPRAIAALVQAVRQQFPGRRLVSIIQPRATGGKDWIYQRDLPLALAQFDKVILTSAYEHAPLQVPAWTNDPFSLDLLAQGLRGERVNVSVTRSMEEIPETLAREITDGDVVVLSVLEQSHALVAEIEHSLHRRIGNRALSRDLLPVITGA